VLATWRAWARALANEVHAIALACRDPRVPWYAKALALLVVAYAFSPIDLIPDVIPILGYLDDLILLPLGVLLVRRLIPPVVLAEYRLRAPTHLADDRWLGRPAAVGIVVLWVVALAVGAWLLVRSVAPAPSAPGSPPSRRSARREVLHDALDGLGRALRPFLEGQVR